ncbi:hypothetical protein ACLB2K_053588 [Fragaria x ananassa]
MSHYALASPARPHANSADWAFLKAKSPGENIQHVRVKAERQKPSGLLEPLPVPVWKLTKSAHFLPVGKKYSLDKLAELFANEKIKVVRDRLKAAQSRQKSYADVRRKDLEFQVGDWVFLKLSPWKGVVRFGKRGKLSSRYIGPYEIIERVGSLAYRLALPSELSRIHNVFHVSMLRKYIADPSHVLEEQPISQQKDLSYEEESVQILYRKEKMLRSKSIPLVKVLWRSQQVEEATWESEEQMRQ